MNTSRNVLKKLTNGRKPNNSSERSENQSIVFNFDPQRSWGLNDTEATKDVAVFKYKPGHRCREKDDPQINLGAKQEDGRYGEDAGLHGDMDNLRDLATRR
jgi:hypothetical protein